MEAENIRKEFSSLFDRLLSLSPSEREGVLLYLRCALPSLNEPLAAAASALQTAGSCSDVQQAPALSTTDACDVILSGDAQWSNSFVLDDTLNLSYFVQTHEKSTNTPDCGALVKQIAKVVKQPSRDQPEPGPNVPATANSVDLTVPAVGDIHSGSQTHLSLRCPVCHREFHKWVKMEDHLYAAHATTVSPVCWHCQGLFASHALLLAHECFDWGRANLPCQSIMASCSTSSTVVDTHHQRVDTSELEFPTDGVFLKRRCGLCTKSQTEFTTYQSFRIHKKTIHSADSRDGFLLSPNRKRRLKPEPTSADDNDNVVSDESFQRHANSNFRSVVRFLFNRFHHQQAEDGNSHDHVAPSSMTMSLLAAQRTRVKSRLSSPILPVDMESRITSNSPISQRRHSRSYYSLTHLLWRRRQRSRAFRPKRSTYFPRNPYDRHYSSRNARFACRCCCASFRAPSHLKAHYLFKHGHVPENLEQHSSVCDEHPHESESVHQQTTEHASTIVSDSSQSTPDFQPRNTDPLVDQVEKAASSFSTTASENIPRNRVKRNTRRNEKTLSFMVNPNSAPSVAEPKRTGPPFCCMYCPQSYSTRFNVRRHERQAHRGHYRFWCGYCEFRTNERCALDEHLARHFGIKHFMCQFCDARFTVRRELSDHIAFLHNTARNFKCFVCELTFKTAGSLSRHRKTHESRTLHQCASCTATFTRLSNMKRHVQRIHRMTKDTCESAKPRRKCRKFARKSAAGVSQIPVDMDHLLEEPNTGANVNLHDQGSVEMEPSVTLETPLVAPLPTSTAPSQLDTILISCPAEATTTSSAVTTNLVPVDTIFLPYINPLTHSIAVGGENAPTSTCNMSTGCPCAPSSQATSLARMPYPSTTITSMFSINLPGTFSASTGDSIYLLTSTTDRPGTVKSNVDSSAVVTPEQSVTGDRMCFTAHFDQFANSELCHLYEPGGTPVPSLSSFGQSHPSASNDDRVTNIWRPMECDLQADSVNSSLNFPSMSLVSPFDPDSDSQMVLQTYHDHPSQTLESAQSTSEVVCSNCSPRFPSPVSCLDSPQPTVFPPPVSSPLHQATFNDYIDDRSSFHIESSSASLSIESGSRSIGCQDVVNSQSNFSCAGFSNPNTTPYQLMTGIRSQFLSPIWTCSTPMDSFQLYPNPTQDVPVTEATDQCSNFSVGYLIGHHSGYAPIDHTHTLTDRVPGSPISSSASTNSYYTFGPAA